MVISPERIYLAGKIGPHDWRHQIVIGLRDKGLNSVSPETDDEPWPVFERAILGEHSFTGPHFIACDHSCGHGPSSHGTGAGKVTGCFDSPSRATVLRRCFEAIRRSTFVFVWLDQPDVYGTLVEVGYAVGHDTPVVIAHPEVPRPTYHVNTGYAGEDPDPRDHFTSDFWFAFEAAQHVISDATSPADGLQKALRARGHHQTVWQRLAADDT